MIKLNDMNINLGTFPDGTCLMHLPSLEGKVTIEWFYENDSEAMKVMFLAKHYQNQKRHLIMPYIPNARQDRVKNKEDVFTLKYFAEFINSLGFETVTVFDPHSSVSEALFNNLVIDSPKKFINKALARLPQDIMAFYPDEGAMKRYSEMIDLPYAFGIKKRDWQTGEIKGLDLAGESVENKDILIIDDICSRGGTFYHSAKRLKEAGAKNIYLYVSHCENTIDEGQIFTSGLIEKVFTTDSIFRFEEGENTDKMEVFFYYV